MAWQHASWETQATYSGQLSELKAFRSELRAAIGPRVEEDGVAWDATAINALLAQSDKDLARIQPLADAENGIGLPRMISTITSRRAN